MFGRGKFIIRNIISAIVAVFIVAFAFLIIFNISFYFIYTKIDVYGFSMQPTLNANIDNRDTKGDTVYVNKYADVKVNDVVVADVRWNNESVIKRLVGTPGDTVKIAIEKNGYALYCNDDLLYIRPIYNSQDEKTKQDNLDRYLYYLKTIQYANAYPNSYFDEIGNFYIELQEDEYFIMGDHWTGSMSDCLSHGPIKKSEIYGRVDFLIKYTEENKIESLGKSILNLIFGKRVEL